MTDNEIIQALECCSTGETYDDCEKNGCPLYLGITMGCKYIDKENQLYSDALDLINRQQAEIEQWKEEAIKRGASEEFINAKPIMCDTCVNGWVQISENGYCAKCTLSQNKATNCLPKGKS